MRKNLFFSIVAVLFSVAGAVAQQNPIAAKPATQDFPEMARASQSTAPVVKQKGFRSPEFPGGKDKMYEYFDQQIRYPAAALKDRVQGDVFVKFTVRKDGSIMDAKVISGLDPDCDKEALRVLLTMPKWQPGTQDDKPVDMNFTMPVRFVIDK
ncbi:MAG: energy transducer TonB [Cytophagales bacterium]|jgi:TonB family protein|nr:energy transducer TonB [Cytophagales bacterium]